MVNVTISNTSGLHARPAANFCLEAKKYEAEVDLVNESGRYNAKSLISIMSAALSCGDTVGIEAKGEEAERAEAGLAAYIESLED